MTVERRLERLENLPAPPEVAPEVRADCRITGWAWRVYLNVLAHASFGAWHLPAPEDAADYRRLLAEALEDRREPLTAEARECLHHQLREAGLGHLLDGEAA